VRLDDQLAGTIAMDEKLGRAVITFPSAYVPGPHMLEIEYHGPITKGTVGFLRWITTLLPVSAARSPPTLSLPKRDTAAMLG